MISSAVAEETKKRKSKKTDNEIDSLIMLLRLPKDPRKRMRELRKFLLPQW
jgi:hypothetical protein